MSVLPWTLNVDADAREGKTLDSSEMTATQLELMLEVEPEAPLQWWAQLGHHQTAWKDVESSEELVAIAQSISRDGDWFTVRTKCTDPIPHGIYVQAMNTGTGYQLEVAQQDGWTAYNWRIGWGVAADDAGNEPNGGVTGLQNLSLAAVVEVLLSWVHGHGLPLGYGASLRIYNT